MAQNVNELKASVLGAVKRQAAEIRSGRAQGFGPQIVAPLNPTGAHPDPLLLSDFATGYGGGVTVVPFTWGLSKWNSGDTWTSS